MRLIDVDKLYEYADNQKDKTVDANDFMRFPIVELSQTEESILSMFRKYHTEAVNNKAIYDPVSWALYQIWTYYDNRRTSWRRDKHDADAENPEIPE